MPLTFLVVVEDHALPALKAFKRWFDGRTDRVILYSGLRDSEPDQLALLETQDLFHDDRRWDHSTFIVESNVDPRKRTAELAKGLDADIVVCAADDTASLLARSLLWTTSLYALHNCLDQAVMIVHQLHIKGECRYMICVDGSKQSDRAARLLVQLLHPGDAVAVFASFTPPPSSIASGRAMMPNPRYEAELQEVHALALRRVTAVKSMVECSPQGDSVTVCSVVEAAGKPCRAALDFANANDIHVIVCGSRGLSTTQRLVFGSFSTFMASNALRQMVLVVH